MSNYACPHCGSIFELNHTKHIMRDKDSIPCPVCRNTLIDWNGAESYSIRRLVERKEPAGDD